MANIYMTLYDIFYRIYSSKDNTRIRVRPEIRDFLYVRHGIEIGETERCSIRTKISFPGSEKEMPIDIIYLNEIHYASLKEYF